MGSVVAEELGVSLLDMKITRVAFYALAFGPAYAHAEFSWELAGLFDHSEQNPDPYETPSNEIDSDLLSVSVTHYFKPVEEGSGPLALAAFLDPHTQLSVSVGEDQTTSEFYAGPNSLFHELAENDVGDYSLRGLYLFAESNWYAGGGYTRREGDGRRTFTSITGTGSGTSSSSGEDYSLFAGKYFGTGATRLELSVERSTEEEDSSTRSCSFSGSCFTSGFNTEVSGDRPSLAVMHVRGFRSATYALRGEISEQRFREGSLDGTPFIDLDLDPPRIYFVGAELYPVPTIGVRLGYETVDEPGAEEELVSVGASWFFRRNVGLDLTLSRYQIDIDNPFDEDDQPSTDRAVLRVIGRL
jgi:hypothetical protein